MSTSTEDVPVPSGSGSKDHPFGDVYIATPDKDVIQTSLEVGLTKEELAAFGALPIVPLCSVLLHGVEEMMSTYSKDLWDKIKPELQQNLIKAAMAASSSGGPARTRKVEL